MRASVLTDFVQALVLIGGLAVALPLALLEVGGVEVLVTELRATDPDLVGQAFPLPEIGGFILASTFGIAVTPQLITRFYTMQDADTVRSAIGLSLVFQGVVAVTVATLGLSARVLYPDLGNPDIAVLVLSQDLLGPLVGTLLIFAIFSAILSTTDTVLLIAGASIAHDIYAKILQPDASERSKLWLNRGAVVVVGAVPAVLTLYRDVFGELITLISLLNLSLIGGMLFVPLLFGLHWRGATTTGGVGAMVSGFVTVLGWHVGTEVVPVVPAQIASFVGDPVIPGVLVSLVTLVGLSWVTSGPSAAATGPFFEDR
jgi:Na+/proline symporter